MRRIFVYEAFSAQRDGPAGPPGVPGDPDAVALREAGVAMRDAIVLDLLRLRDVRVTCATGDAPGCGLPVWHERLDGLSARPQEDAVAFVRRAQARHDACWIVAPETGGLLLRLQAAVAPGRRVGCDPQAIQVAASKRATLALVAAHGLATPRDFDGADGWIVKPDDGAGTRATHWFARAADARAAHAARPSAVLEPFVPGEALSVSLVVGPGAVRAVAVNRQHVAIDEDGRLRDDGVEPAALDDRADPRVPALHRFAERVVRVLPGLRGFVGIDLVWHPRRGPVLVEINPRTTCAYVGLSARLGRNLAREVLQTTPETSDAVPG